MTACRTGICKRAAVPDSPWCGACLQVLLSDAFGPPLANLRDHYETLPAEVQTPRRDDDVSPHVVVSTGRLNMPSRTLGRPTPTPRLKGARLRAAVTRGT